MNANIPTELKNIKRFLTVSDLESTAFRKLLDFAIERKKAFKAGQLEPIHRGKTLAMIFQKPSLRTRLSFEVAMVHLGGHAVNLEDHQIGMGRREASQDVARVASSMCNAIMARVFEHSFVEALARYATVPVINGLSDYDHPCQAGADMMTLIERYGEVAGKRLVFVGDGFNIARSLAMSCASLGMSFAQSAPKGYELSEPFLDSVRRAHPTVALDIIPDPKEAVTEADIVVTDTWTSMGQEAEKQKRLADFEGYQVNADLMGLAKKDAVVLHCLPAYRNVEITDDVIDGPQSLVFQEAENRLHFQRALLETML